MRPLYGLIFLLAACAATESERFKSGRPTSSTREQRVLVKQAMTMYWNGGDEYAAVVAKCSKDRDVAQALAMHMVVKMEDTEQLQRRRQGTEFQLRTMEENIPYTRARTTIVKLGEYAMPVIEELVRHPHIEKRSRGVEILSRMPPSVLSAVEQKFAACPVKYRRHYVEAVAGMQLTPQSELLLVEWSKSADFSVRAAALTGLAKFGDRHLALLRDIVQRDGDVYVQRQVVKQLGQFRDRATVAAVIAYYGRCTERGDRHGMREAERTLVLMSKSPPSRGGRLIHYGLAHWKRWVMTLPVDGGNG